MEEVALKRRADPGVLRHLAGKLREGEQYREAVALDTLAGEIEEPAAIRDAGGVQVCFCDLGGKPYDDPASHNGGCLMPGFLAAWEAGKRTTFWTPFRDRVTEGG